MLLLVSPSEPPLLLIETLQSAGRARLSMKISAIEKEESKSTIHKGERSPAGTIPYI